MPSGSILAALVLMLGAAAPPQPVLDEAFLDRVEAIVVLPAKAKPVAAYSRSYFPLPGGTKVVAVYSLFEPPGRRWVQSHPGPFILDGGCATITVMIDITAGTPDSVECGGEA